MQWHIEPNRVYATDETGQLLAEITFPTIRNHVVDINHTFVSPALRGQGIAGQLMEKAVRQIKSTGRRCRVSCTYAEQWMQKHQEWADVLEIDKTDVD